ncbi:MAG TPA: OadG family protein [Desulfatirhabdiaceae bacterium]|nr:OadG family protein [Desulfatirhabdiaceae bacterium]
MFLNRIKVRRTIWMVIVLLVLPFMPKDSCSMLGEDLEKPRPEFTRDGDIITAKLIPRAKNTSVQFEFRVTGGELKDVQGVDFLTVQTPDVDIKEFKSALFAVLIDSIRPGAAADVTVTSSFFSMSTEYWICNTRNAPIWVNSAIKPEKISDDGTYRFGLRVIDGGPMDSDGAVNGSILFTGGPRDPFWSYALGTLLIRFFGIFLVLGVLMVGMVAAGKIFVAFDRKGSRRQPISLSIPSSAKKNDAPSKTAIPTKMAAQLKVEPDVVAAMACAIHLSGLSGSVPDQDTAVAIATALHLHLTQHHAIHSFDSRKNMPTSWVQYGREALQNVRLQAFQRPVNNGRTQG